LAVILAVVLVLPAAAFAMLPEANARSSTGMDGPEATKIVDHDTSNHWKFWAGGYDGSKVTTQNVGRIWTDKTVQAIDDGKSDFLTTLSAMSSTSDTTSLVSKPLDIVMVLDASGSMDDPMGGEDSPKRIDALKNAANHFIDTIAEQNKNVKDASKQHQVAIVKFAGEQADKVGNDTYYSDEGYLYNYSQTMQKLTACSGGGVEGLKGTINSIKPNGATRADNGMELAKGITSGREDAQKVVVFFTDGKPTRRSDFSPTVANNAIAAAKAMKDEGATVYTIGIFDGADPSADPTSYKTSDENKFMHAMSSNYPKATSYTSGKLGDRVAGATYYKSAANAAELDQVFADISSAITSGKGFPTKVEGNNPNGSGYITFEDELGAFMQVDSFTGAEYNGKTYGAATKSTDGNIDTYTFDGELAHLVITVDRADENNPQRGDIVTVKVPASLIPLRRFTVDESAGTFVVDSTEAISPIRVAYASSVKAIARKNLFTPNNVPGLQDYINEHKDADSNTVSFYANKWTGDDAGDTVASFEPAATNSYYYFQKLTPVYTDAACTKLATEKPSGSKTYWYKDEFMAQNSSGAPYDDSVSIPVKGSELENFEGALVKDGDHWSIKAGTARLAFINQLHTTKERVGGNPTDTARDVINPQWNNTKVVSGATKVNVYLGNNGKISFTLNTTPTTLTTADFGLTKVLEGREWTNEDKFEFGLTSKDNAPMPRSTTAFATKGHADISFGEIAYDKSGTYVYKVSEKHAGTTVDGIAYSKNVAEFTVTVTPNAKGKLEASVKKTSGEVEFKNTYTANPAESSVTDQITVTKVLTGHKLQDNEFSFELVEGEGEDASVVETVKNDANGNVAFSAIKYTEIGQHIYTLREVKGNAGGIAYDKTVYTVVTTIADNGKGQLVATHKLKGAEDVKKIEFKNSYTVTPKSSSVTDQIIATKSLTGRKLAAGEFSFELVEGDKVVATGTNDASGNITMGAVKYTEAGKHTYTLREAKGGTTSKGIAYSDAKYTIETTITDNGDGTLKAEHVLKDATAATFKNTYSVAPLDAELDFDLSKVISGRDWTDGDEFSFTITAPEGAPLPDPATATVSKKDAEDGIAAIKFGKIHYAAAGTYKYEIRENAGSTVGMTYDAHVATAEVTVTEDGEGNLTANVTKKENGRFTNTYRTELNYTAAGGLKLSKSLSGRPMTEGQFTFTVTADEASANALGLLPGANNFKSPATVEAMVGLIDILAGHEVKFTQADAGKTFTYTVAEKNDGKPGYTYDDAVRTVTIAVADDGAGTLTATTTVSGGPEGTHTTVHKSGENKVESALVPFHNSYSATTNTPGGTAAQVVATKTLTGRPMADGEFWFGIAYQGELVGYENLKPNIGGHVSFDALHYDTEMLANLEAAGLAYRTDKDGKLAWTINYTAYEDLFGLPNGVSATTWSFGFKVIVVDNGDGTLTATVDYGGVEPLFENAYGADAVDAALTGTKKLQVAEGLTPADITGKFTFTVTADEAGAPMPERTTVTNDAAGNVDFGKIHFTLEDLNRALGVTDDATDKAEADEADDVDADEAEADADADANVDEPGDESEPAAPTAPRSHTFTYTVTESGSAPGVTNDANATRKVSYTVTDDGAGHLSVVRDGDDGAAFTFTNTYGVTPTDSSVTDQVKTVKRLTGRDLAAGEFTFELLEDDVVVANGTNDANGTVTLSPIRYEAPGTHTYTLREACPNALGLYKGVTYDGTTYTVVTTVSDNGDGTLTAAHKLEGATESAGFTNKYHAMPTQVSIGAIKVLEGRELKKDEFSFKLVGEDIESTVANDADGKISFDKFEYDEPGTYVYTISEVKGDEAGMTYDKSVFTATVNVVDDGEGNLKANVAFTKGDKSVEGIVFNNTYKKPETPVPTPDPGTPKTVTNIVKTVKGFLPTTGDQQAAALLMAFVIAMAGVGALVWGIRKR
jgi:pilin isopeptide linkage protein/LPXTG-motif cell wall-anchored protein